MKAMKVLIACEESQRVCIAFRKRGHEAYSCDIQECSGGHPEWHIMGDALAIINGRCAFQTMDGEWHYIERQWDLIIAHPECRYLSNAGARWLFPGGVLNPERYAKGLEAKAFFMKFYNADCPKICVENPVPSSVYDMPKPTQWIQPHEHGDPYTKKTGLWLKGLKPLEPSNPVEPIGPFCPSGTGRKNPATYGAAKRGEDAKNRAKTFPGIAEAMAEQWG